MFAIKPTFDLKRNTCKLFRSLTKLEIMYSPIKSDKFQIICEELKNLEELSIMNLEDISQDNLYRRSRRYEKYYDKRNGSFYRRDLEIYTFKDLLKLRRLKRLHLTLEKLELDHILHCENYVFDKRHKLEEIQITVIHTNRLWLNRMKKRTLEDSSSKFKFAYFSSSDRCFIYDRENDLTINSKNFENYTESRNITNPEYLLALVGRLKGHESSFFFLKLRGMITDALNNNNTDKDLDIIWQVHFEVMKHRKNDNNSVGLFHDDIYLEFLNRMLECSQSEYRLRQLIIVLMEWFHEQRFATDSFEVFFSGITILDKKWSLVEQIFPKWEIFKLIVRLFYDIYEEACYCDVEMARRSLSENHIRTIVSCVEDNFKICHDLFDYISSINVFRKVQLHVVVREFQELFARNRKDYIHNDLVASLRTFLNYYISCIREVTGKPIDNITAEKFSNKDAISSLMLYNEEILKDLNY
ncbi:DgyrCDS3854 [Dimorphilus gyrociliatus]|uniref:DgyrCDS3854 n=1 Tax=Dimorphilus gyrociliatus TaxID=2664684 RepID=A0A7I8VGN0_9ANNE|nr:DgyrCDS3854 [Dimorphilus gyrociliatus]